MLMVVANVKVSTLKFGILKLVTSIICSKEGMVDYFDASKKTKIKLADNKSNVAEGM